MQDKIDQDLKTAMLASDIVTVSVLRMVKSAFQNQAIANQGKLSDEDAVKVLRKEVKKRLEAAEMYKQANEEVRQSAELAEAEIIEKYLPAQMSEADVSRIIEETMKELDSQNMGEIMGAVMKKLEGQSDGGTVSRLVREKLAQ